MYGLTIIKIRGIVARLSDDDIAIFREFLGSILLVTDRLDGFSTHRKNDARKCIGSIQ